MNKKRMLAFLLAFAMVISVCTNPMQAQAKAKKTKVTKVVIKNELYGKKLYVAKGKKVTLKTDVKVTPNKKANKKVTFKSKKASIAKVDKKGKVTGKKVGSTKITVTSKTNKKKKTTVTVQVTKPVKTVSLNQKTLTLEAGKNATLKATVSPTKKVCKFVKWTSSNEKVATVDKNGKVVAVAEGTASITATSVDGTKKKAVCAVTVKKAATQTATEKKTTEKKKEDNKKDEKNTVKKVSIKSVQIVDECFKGFSNKVKVVLTSDKELKKESFEVVRISEKSEPVKVISVTKRDNATYLLTLEEELEVGDVCKVIIKELDGETKEMQVRYILPVIDTNGVIVGEVCPEDAGEEYEDDSYVSDYYVSESIQFGNMFGEYTAELDSGELPEGLEFEKVSFEDEEDYDDEDDSEDEEYEDEEDEDDSEDEDDEDDSEDEDDEDDSEDEEYCEYRVYGYPQEKTSKEGQRVVFLATDSNNATSKATYDVIIADENEIYTSNQTYEAGNYYADLDNSMIFKTWAIGGSGRYRVDIEDAALADKFEVEVWGKYIEFFSNSSKFEPGKYTIPFKVTDINDESKIATGKIEFVVDTPKKVELEVNEDDFVTDLYFVNQSTDEEFYYGFDPETNAPYVLVPDGVYDVYESSLFGYNNIVKSDVAVNTDMKLSLEFSKDNVFSVDMVKQEKAVVYDAVLDDGEEEIHYLFYDVKGGLFKLPDGKYKLKILCSDQWESKWTQLYSGRIMVDNGYTFKFTEKKEIATGMTIQATVKTARDVDVTTIAGKKYVVFKPSATGEYSLALNELEYDDEYDEYYDFYYYGCIDLGTHMLYFNDSESVSFTGEAGTTYYIAVWADNYEEDEDCVLSIREVE